MVLNSSVYPSGTALAARSVPMLPEAPTILSMTTGWPQASLSFWPTRRTRKSGALPGGAGTITRTDFSG
jgi:hypothetical protein